LLIASGEKGVLGVGGEGNDAKIHQLSRKMFTGGAISCKIPVFIHQAGRNTEKRGLHSQFTKAKKRKRVAGLRISPGCSEMFFDQEGKSSRRGEKKNSNGAVLWAGTAGRQGNQTKL